MDKRACTGQNGLVPPFGARTSEVITDQARSPITEAGSVPRRQKSPLMHSPFSTPSCRGQSSG